MPVHDEDLTILRALLEAGEGFVSGSDLAGRLGVSRVSVRARMQRLEETGFTLEAVRNKGYRLAGQPGLLHAALLEACLIRLGVSVDLHVHEEIDSTNSEAERLLSAGASTPLVVLASRQSAGRGRMGRRWHSEDAENLYLSFAFRPQLPPARMTKFTLWMGASLCDFLDEKHAVHARVKWPNDLLCDGRKLAGMLTEARIDADFTRDLIFGLGLNVNADPTTLPEEVREIATSVRAVSGQPRPINPFAAEVIACLMNAYEQFVDGSFEKFFKQRWIDYDCLNGQQVTVRGHAGELTGTVAGVNDDGSLALIRADGTRMALRAGDVSLGTGSAPST